MIKKSVNQLVDEEIDIILEELKEQDPNIKEKLEYLIKEVGGKKSDLLEYLVQSDPVLWAKTYFNWDARKYQRTILSQGKKRNKVVLRLGRRLGKTECMCILILWHAFTQYNKGANNQYDILIITPYEKQVDVIFDRLHQLIDLSPLFKGQIKRDIYHRIELSNGTKITGMTAGSKSGNGAANTRGQRADVIVLDEIDYMGSAQITNILNIRNEAPERIKVIAASTPSGKHEEFYEWCVNSSRSFRPSQEDIDNLKFTGYVETVKKGNGWTEVYAPSTVNVELLKNNPDTGRTYIEDFKLELSEVRYTQEVMAEFGEEEMGVYQHKYIEQAIAEGERIGLKYTTEMSRAELEKYLAEHPFNKRILGVDWDRVQAGTNLVCVELDEQHINEDGQVEPKFKILFRVEVPRSEYTYTEAVDKIIELNDIYNFDWIAIDRGYGDTQIEMLKKYGMANPETGLLDKILPYQFGQNIVIRDPHTRRKIETPMKPFMVNNSVITFEKAKIILKPDDKEVIKQFGGYRVVSITSAGMPVYSSNDEHIVDATNLALLAFEQKYGELMKTVISSKAVFIPAINGREAVLQNRELGTNLELVSIDKKKSGFVDLTVSNKRRMRNHSITSIRRSTF